MQEDFLAAQEYYEPPEELGDEQKPPSVTMCTGCGIRLQTQTKEMAGYINPKYLQVEQVSPLDQNEEELLAKLAASGATQEILDEFRNHSLKSGPINDIETLMQLDSLGLPEKREVSNMYRKQRKQSTKNLC